MTLPGGAPEEKKLLERFERAKVYASLRYVSGIGGIRLAVHETNQMADVDAMLDIARRFLRKPSKYLRMNGIVPPASR